MTTITGATNPLTHPHTRTFIPIRSERVGVWLDQLPGFVTLPDVGGARWDDEDEGQGEES